MLQGERDHQVTMEDFRRWEEALCAAPDAWLWSYPALDHLFREGSGPSGPQDYDQPGDLAPRVIDDVAAWITTGRRPRAR